MKVAAVVLRLSHDGGDGVAVVMVGEMVTWWSRWWHGGAAVVVVLEVAAAARGGEWCGGSSRSGDKKRFWFRPESSLEKFSGDGERWKEVAGGGWWLPEI
nr:hypothetical protein [Tanacetum cinerariifolium]